MKFTLSWLCEHLDTDASVEQITDNPDHRLDPDPGAGTDALPAATDRRGTLAIKARLEYHHLNQ